MAETESTSASSSKSKSKPAKSLAGEPADEKAGEAFTPDQLAEIESGEYPTANQDQHSAEEKADLQADQEERIEAASK